MVNRPFRLIGVLFMLVTLTGVSTGFTLMQHICLMDCSPNSAVSEEVMDCCADSKPVSDVCVEQSCCSEELSFVKFDFSALTQQPSDFVALPVSMLPEISVSAAQDTDDLSTCKTTHPPPLLTTEFLAYLSIYRI